MAAIVAPPNTSGIPPPPDLVVPITYEDIASARKYIEDLSWTRGQSIENHRLTLMAHSSTANPAHQAPATMDVIGRAEAYRSSLVFAVEQGPAAPLWIQELNTNIIAMRADVTALRADVNAMQGDINMMRVNIDTMQGDVTRLLQKSDEEPIILANSRAGNRERLYDPTQLQAGWAAQLVRPQHRDELLTMSGRSNFVTQSVVLLTCVSAQDCITTAITLGLPHLPPATAVVERRRQIARRIGVSID
jgi:hypothetical protein